MIEADYLLSLLGFSIAMAFTPGPNNMMVMASGLSFGFRRTLPHVLGIGLGVAVMVMLVALGLGQVFTRYPLVFSLMKGVGALYLLWMAWTIARVDVVSEGEARGAPFTFLQSAGFQWVNPKAWIMILSVSATYSRPEAPVASALLLGLVMGVMGFVSSATWTVFGTALRPLLRSRGAVQWFNRIMALLLVASLWPIVADLVRR